MSDNMELIVATPPASTPPTMGGPFPPELWLTIFKHYNSMFRGGNTHNFVPHESTIRTSPRGLKAARLVNSVMKYFADEVLFEELAVSMQFPWGQRSAEKYALHTFFSNHPQIPARVKTAYFGLPNHNANYSMLRVDDSLPVLGQFSNLERLVLQCPRRGGSVDFWRYWNRVIATSPMPTSVRHLVVDSNVHDFPDVLPFQPLPLIQGTSLWTIASLRAHAFFGGLKTFAIRLRERDSHIGMDQFLRSLMRMTNLEGLEIVETGRVAQFAPNEIGSPFRSFGCRNLTKLTLISMPISGHELRLMLTTNPRLEYLSLISVALLSSTWADIFEAAGKLNDSLVDAKFSSLGYVTNSLARHGHWDSDRVCYHSRWESSPLNSESFRDMRLLRALYHNVLDRLQGQGTRTALRQRLQTHLAELASVRDREQAARMDECLIDLSSMYDAAMPRGFMYTGRNLFGTLNDEGDDKDDEEDDN